MGSHVHSKCVTRGGVLQVLTSLVPWEYNFSVPVKDIVNPEARP